MNVLWRQSHYNIDEVSKAVDQANILFEKVGCPLYLESKSPKQVSKIDAE